MYVPSPTDGVNSKWPFYSHSVCWRWGQQDAAAVWEYHSDDEKLFS